jgi:hypothetical protein
MPTTYLITVQTGDVENAGSDANVFITLFGANASSGERFLDNAEDNFERGRTDVFSHEMRDLGEIRFVRIRHDNTGNKPGWFLERILIQNQQTGAGFVFPCSRWLAFDEDDNRVDRILARG